MNKPILDSFTLALANLGFWRLHVADLAKRRQWSMARGESVLCDALEHAHHIATMRCQRANEEYLRAKNGGRL